MHQPSLGQIRYRWRTCENLRLEMLNLEKLFIRCTLTKPASGFRKLEPTISIFQIHAMSTTGTATTPQAHIVFAVAEAYFRCRSTTSR